MKIFATALALTLLTAGAAQSHSTITEQDDQTCIMSDGNPDHETGPWREGAVVIAQDHNLCVDATPALTGEIAENVRISGITVTGIPLRPGTAEYYDRYQSGVIRGIHPRAGMLKASAV